MIIMKKRRKRLFFVLDKIKEGKGTLLIGGDFFDFWFETNAVIPNGYKDLIDNLGNLQKYNIDIHYIAGNQVIIGILIS